MKKRTLPMKKALRSVLLVLLLSAVGMTKVYATYDFSAVCETGQTLYYNITDAENHYVELTFPGLTGYTGWSGFVKPTGEISLSSSVDYNGITYTVTSIGNNALSYCSELTTIEIPNSVTSIDSWAFARCSGLTSISIPNSVIYIGGYAFYYCTGLTSVEMPNAVTSIGEYAFSGCSGLTSVVIPNAVVSIGNAAFSFCTGLTSVEIPNAVTSIVNYMFCNCTSLSTVEIPNTVVSIGNSAFSYCIGLTSVEIPSSVTSIGYAAFSNCTGLTSVEIPNSVTSIGDHAFYYCTGLTSVEMPNAVTSIGDYMFYYCTGLTSVEIPDAVTSIGNYAFTSCMGLTSIEIPNAVTLIGKSAFSSCMGLTSMTVWAENPPTLKNGVFNLVDKFIPVYVPCGSLQSYHDNGWNEFTNIQGMGGCPVYEITATANPTEGGTVTGGGEYTQGTTCTLTATPNEGYFFLNWKMDGEMVSTEATYSFTVTEDATLVANFEAIILQTIPLSPGWNWYSTYIEQEGIDGLGQLENSIGIPQVRIESQYDGYVRSIVHNGITVWVGALTSINNEEMYKIRTKEACEATMEGTATDPALHPITINRGWNSVGFPCSQCVSVDVAMSGFTPQNNDVIKGIHSYATYNNGTWSGTLNTLEPGQGYMYGSKSNATKTLVFQTGNRGEATLANITPENNYYQPVEDYADNMTVIAVVELDGEELRSDDYEVAAFVGDECRGSVKLMYVEPIDRYVAFLTVFGDEAEDLHFVLTDGATSDLSADHLTYTIDGIEGTLDEPVVLRFGVTDVNENVSVNVRVYPNPSEGIFNIEGQNIRKVEVFNAFGQPVCSMDTENGYLKLDLTNRASGIYLIRVISDDGIQSHQIMKR